MLAAWKLVILIIINPKLSSKFNIRNGNSNRVAYLFLCLPHTQSASCLILWRTAPSAVWYALQLKILVPHSGDSMYWLWLTDMLYVRNFYHVVLCLINREYLTVPLLESGKINSSSAPLGSYDIPFPNNGSSNIDGALIVYTSGTTGRFDRYQLHIFTFGQHITFKVSYWIIIGCRRPKAVVHTHDGINHMIWSLTTAWKYADTDKILHFLPLYHIHGILNKMVITKPIWI